MVFLLDPLIATGGTAIAAIHMLTDWGVPGPYPHPSAGFYATVNPTVFPVTRIKLLSILASEDGLKSVQSKFPDLEVIIT